MPIDEPDPRRLTRRQPMSLVAGAGVGLALGTGALAAFPDVPVASAASCVLTPEGEEGPYYVALETIRKNIVGGLKGVPLYLAIHIVDPTSCAPIKNAAVDIWHCDAAGVYSAESSQHTSKQTWLRGVQLTDANGLAKFVTIYPGHYQGRTTHIHIKVHADGAAHATRYSGGHVAHTGQLYFPDTTSTQVYRRSPYRSSTNARTTNAQDHVFTSQGGAKTILALKRRGSGLSHGFTANIALGVDPTASPAPVGLHR